ncbi:MAG TPA: transglutaminase family protein [Rhizobiaceae bacterium]|nr:transglutaminase family protein [Rhizobiaceae bacterium]
MRLTIRHETVYRYDAPVRYALQRVRQTPVNGPGQKVLEWAVGFEGAERDCSYTDGFGNKVLLARMSGQEIASLSIVAAGIVETTDNAGVYGKTQGFTPAWLYCRLTPLTTPDDALCEIGATHLGPGDRLSALHALSGAIRDRISYDPEKTEVTTTAAQSFAAGHGVCQDHAHIFIAACRSAGQPTRYVSGYLFVEGEQNHVASHAWAEAWVDGLGWVGFDVSNRICPDERYVRVACGLDYTDAAPVTGLRRGAANEALDVRIVVNQ